MAGCWVWPAITTRASYDALHLDVRLFPIPSRITSPSDELEKSRRLPLAIATTWSSYVYTINLYFILVFYETSTYGRWCTAAYQTSYGTNYSWHRDHLPSRSSNLKPRMPVALERKGWTNIRTYLFLTCMVQTFAHSLLTPHRTRPDPPHAVPSELAVRKRRASTVNHEKSRSPWPGNRWPATSSSLVCSRDLPVCQHRSVLCPLGIPTHSKQCYDAALKVNSSGTIRTNAKFSLQQKSDYFQTFHALHLVLGH